MIKRLTGKVLQNKAFSVSVFYQVLLAAYRERGHGSDSNQMQPFHAGASSLTLAGVIIKKEGILVTPAPLTMHILMHSQQGVIDNNNSNQNPAN